MGRKKQRGTRSRSRCCSPSPSRRTRRRRWRRWWHWQCPSSAPEQEHEEEQQQPASPARWVPAGSTARRNPPGPRPAGGAPRAARWARPPGPATRARNAAPRGTGCRGSAGPRAAGSTTRAAGPRFRQVRRAGSPVPGSRSGGDSGSKRSAWCGRSRASRRWLGGEQAEDPRFPTR